MEKPSFVVFGNLLLEVASSSVKSSLKGQIASSGIWSSISGLFGGSPDEEVMEEERDIVDKKGLFPLWSLDFLIHGY